MADYKKMHINTGDALSDWYLENPENGQLEPLDCLVLDGDVVFGHMINPSIGNVKRFETIVQFTLGNQNTWEEPVSQQIYYEIGNSDPNADNIEVVPKDTSGNLQITGLEPNTEYTLYAKTYYDGVYSGVAEVTFSTGNFDENTFTVESTTTVSGSYHAKAYPFESISVETSLTLSGEYYAHAYPFESVLVQPVITISGAYSISMDFAESVVAQPVMTLSGQYATALNFGEIVTEQPIITLSGSYGISTNFAETITEHSVITISGAYVSAVNFGESVVEQSTLTLTGAYNILTNFVETITEQPVITLSGAYIISTNFVEVVPTVESTLTLTGAYGISTNFVETVTEQSAITLSGTYDVSTDFAEVVPAVLSTITLSGAYAISTNFAEMVPTVESTLTLSGSYQDYVYRIYEESVSGDSILTLSGAYGISTNFVEVVPTVESTVTLSGAYVSAVNFGESVVEQSVLTLNGIYNVSTNFVETVTEQPVITLSGAYNISTNFVEVVPVVSSTLTLSGTYASSINFGESVVEQSTLTLTGIYNVSTNFVEMIPTVSSTLTLSGIYNVSTNFVEIVPTVGSTLTLSGAYGISTNFVEMVPAIESIVTLSGAYGISTNFVEVVPAVSSTLTLTGSYQDYVYRIHEESVSVDSTLTLSGIYNVSTNFVESVPTVSSILTLTGIYNVSINFVEMVPTVGSTLTLTGAYDVSTDFVEVVPAVSSVITLSGSYQDYVYRIYEESVSVDSTLTLTGVYNLSTNFVEAVPVVSSILALSGAYDVSTNFVENVPAVGSTLTLSGVYGISTNFVEIVSTVISTLSLNGAYGISANFVEHIPTVGSTITVSGSYGVAKDFIEAVPAVSSVLTISGSYDPIVAPDQPTISLQSRTESTITWRITNPNDISLTLYYDDNNSVAHSTTIAANSYFDFQVTGKSDATEYTCYAYLVNSGVASPTTTFDSYTVPSEPTINYISDTTSSVTYTITNNSSKALDIYYGIGTTNLQLQSLGAGATSSDIVSSGLDEDTDYTFYAKARIPGVGLDSSTDSHTQRTDLVPPTITFVSDTDTSCGFTVTNNSDRQVDILMEVGDSTPDVVKVSNLAAGATSETLLFTGLDAGNTYTFYARSRSDVSSQLSAVVSHTETIDPPDEAPRITLQSRGETTLTWRIHNDNNYSVTCNYDSSHTLANSTTIAANDYFDYQIQSLDDATQYSLDASFKVGSGTSTATTTKSDYTKPSAPTIIYESDTADSVTYNVKNESSQTVDIYWEVGDSTPDSVVSDLASGSTTPFDLVTTGLDDDTEYTFYARAYKNGIYSDTVSHTQRTDMAKPTINFVSDTQTSYTCTVTNNSVHQADILMKMGGGSYTVKATDIAPGETSNHITFTGLNAGSTYSFFAQARSDISSQISAADSDTETIDVPSNPSLSVVSRTDTSITFRIANPNDYSVTCNYGNNSSVTSDVTIDANDHFDYERTLLTEATSYDVYANLQVGSGDPSSTVSLSAYTRPANPSISFDSAGVDSLSYEVTNNSAKTVTIYYGIGSADNTVSLSAGSTTTVTDQDSSYDDDTNYTFYVKARYGGQYSETVSDSHRTAMAKPTIDFVSDTDTTYTCKVTNNSVHQADILMKVGNTAYTVKASNLAAGETSSNITFTDLDAGNTYSFYAQARSDVSSQLSVADIDSETLDAPSAPTLSLYERDATSIKWRMYNPNDYTITVNYGDTTDATNSVSIGALGIVSYERTSLTEATEYTMYANSQVGSGVKSSNATRSDYTRPAQPTISLNYVTTLSQNYEVTNNSAKTVDIYWDFGNSDPTTLVASLGPGETSGELSTGSLDDDTNYTFYAKAVYQSVDSNVVSDTNRTELAKPTIIFGSHTDTTYTCTVKNNSVHQVDILMDPGDTTPDTVRVTDLAAGATSGDITFTGLAAGTGYTFYAKSRSDISSQLSEYDSDYEKMDPPTAPTLALQARTDTSITFRITNPNDYSVTCEYGPTSTKGSSVTISANSYYDYERTSLTDATEYDAYASLKVIGGDSSATTSISDYTQPSAPTVTFVSITPNSMRCEITNNSSRSLTIRYGAGSNYNYSGVFSSGASAEKTISSLPDDTLITYRARAEYSSVYSDDDSHIERTPVAVPDLIHVSTGSESATFKVKNNSIRQVDVKLEEGDSTPTVTRAYNVDPGETTGNITITGLSPNTTYTFYARVYTTTSRYSDTDTSTHTTDMVPANAPSISNISSTWSTYYNRATVSYRVYNEHMTTANLYAEIGDSTPDVNRGSVSPLSYVNVTEYVYSGGTHTIYAKATASGYEDSSVTSETVNVVAAPKLTITDVTATSVRFTIENNYDETVTIYYELNDSTPDQYSVSVGAGNSIQRELSVNPDTSYTLYARHYVNGSYTPSDSESFTTPSSGTKEWSYVTYHTSSVSGDREITDYSVNSGSDAEDALEAAYPASNQTVGDIGVVYDGTVWWECEVQ